MIKYRWRWICDLCGHEVESDQGYEYHFGEVIAKATWRPPYDWEIYNNQLICERHIVTIENRRKNDES